jgi:hypothetical protein
MKTCLSAAAVSLVLMFALALLPGLAGSAEPLGSSTSAVAFRPARVRAFAPESATSVVVREGRERYLRLTLADACPALAHAQRLAFQVGPGLVASDQDGTLIPVVRDGAPAVLSAATPHAHVVAVASNGRVACRLAEVAEVDRALFDAAATVHGSRDNRYAGDGRPAG